VIYLPSKHVFVKEKSKYPHKKKLIKKLQGLNSEMVALVTSYNATYNFQIE